MITLKTYGGLANRMRVIDSTYQVARVKHDSVKVIWEMSHELNCSFFRLFNPLHEFELKEFYTPRLLKKANNGLKNILRKVNINLPLGYDKYILDKDIEIAKENKNVPELFNQTGSIYLNTVHQFYTNKDSFSYLKPIQELEDKIQKIKSQFSVNTIGIHIRRADNALSIQHSPIEDFISEMNSLIEKEPQTKFFLATDSISEEKELKKIFPNRIITLEKELSRNSEKGIQDALIDLYCLSNTKKIIGSYYSSFSEVAAQINRIPLQLIIKN